ncbi:MAG: DEAD/DEAH box helicase family protein [Lachnospiraceae bacterium]|nr:DEAD/DEAH box helicase family protein [Lachnospiraceae bacterium]
MLNDVLSEKEYQKYILDRLSENGYEIKPASGYDRLFAIDREALFRFLNTTQPDEMDALRKVYKSDLENTIIGVINTEETKARGSRLDVLKHGIEIANHKLELMYTKPATTFNPALNKLYEQNIFSVSEEVWASDHERIDLVIFLNGLAIMTFELKCNAAGQSYQDAIYQYRMQRDPKTRLFRWKAGALVDFAMDLEQVYMTTKLDGESTFFLPFNMGKGEGIDTGAGNPIYKDKYSVYYMWEDILQKDTLIEILGKFMFIEVKEKKDPVTDKKKRSETVIFPRYHQLDVIRKTLAEVVTTGSSQNYLIQHSAGSGKTNSIAWLAHRLASLHDKENKIIFDNIIICTDRVVVDRQLQQAVMGIEHKAGMIRVMDEKCNSNDLALAIQGNTKIIATTIQKFPYIVDSVKGLKNKRFAVIIDEAHSSTAGKNMAAVTMTLGNGDELVYDTEDMIVDQISKQGKQANVSMFAFTATPKPTTIQLFGRENTNGQKEAFHFYTMKQAIEEGFILDVLDNYLNYKTFYELNKEIEEDPKLQTNAAKRQIARFVELHDVNIAQRIEVIIEHFRTSVKDELGGHAKAMVVTNGRESAVKYRKAFEEYINKKGYGDIHALVAFSGKVTLEDKEYTEAGMNGISEKNLPAEFDKDDYQVLLVADKYQTGFDQPKLCAMYILKKLHGVTAVQTLSRLNRICPPYEKKTFVLDFVNKYEDIVAAFSKYYTKTVLSNSVTPRAIYDIEAKIDGYFFLDPTDVESFNKVLYESAHTAKDKKQMTFYLQKAKCVIDGFADDKRAQVALDIRHFIRFYEFLLQASCFEDVELHKKYNFLSYLIAYIRINHGGAGYNLDGMIKASGFFQKKGEEHKKGNITASPVLKLPMAYDIVLTPAKEERLSQIIREINSRTGKQYDNDVAIKAALQIRDIMKKSEELKTSAKNNSEQDFEFAYFDHVDDALIDGLEQNQDFFTLLLQNDEIKREVLGLFLSDTYHSLRNGEEAGSGIVYQYENPEPMMVAEEPVYYGKKDK